MRLRPSKLGIAWLALSISGLAQIDPHPKDVHRLANGASISALSVASVELPELRPGTRQIAWIKLASQSAARTVKFESIDQMGKLIATLPAIKGRNEDAEYMVLVDVPRQAFRIRAVGVDLTGAAYERAFSKLFWPTAAKPSAGSDAQQALITQLEAEQKSHPDGVIAISPIDISAVGYEPLVVNASIVGIRLWYSVRFSADGVYSLSPLVYPAYEDAESQGLVTMRVLREKLEPQPEVSASGAPAKFRSGTEYREVLEMIPDYVVNNTLQNKFCIYEAKFPAQGKGRDLWNLVKSNPLPVQYRVDIPGLNFAGLTEPFHPQRSFYEGFLKQGAFDCGPAPASKF
jgi:hypothetical protein